LGSGTFALCKKPVADWNLDAEEMHWAGQGKCEHRMANAELIEPMSEASVGDGIV
jgi:hypothetical protein